MNNENEKIMGYDSKNRTTIYETQHTQPMNYQQSNHLDKKEYKKQKKEEKRKVLKAREIVGFNYLITLILVNMAPGLLFEYTLKDNQMIQVLFSFLWYTVLPFVGAYLIKKLHFKKLKQYITIKNYKKIRIYSIIDLSILGIWLITIYFNNILLIPFLISYVLSVIYLINEMDKLAKQV